MKKHTFESKPDDASHCVACGNSTAYWAHLGDVTPQLDLRVSQRDTCVDCKFVGTYRRPRIQEDTGFDDQMQFYAKGDEGLAEDDDGDETVYLCKRPTDLPQGWAQQGLLGEFDPFAGKFAGTERLVPLKRRQAHDDNYPQRTADGKLLKEAPGPGQCNGWVSTVVVDVAELERRAERKAQLDRLVAASAARAARDDSTPKEDQ
jgi:hypothetical protein